MLARLELPLEGKMLLSENTGLAISEILDLFNDVGLKMRKKKKLWEQLGIFLPQSAAEKKNPKTEYPNLGNKFKLIQEIFIYFKFIEPHVCMIPIVRSAKMPKSATTHEFSGYLNSFYSETTTCASPIEIKIKSFSFTF